MNNSRITILLLTLSLLYVPSATAQSNSEKPNILWIVSEDNSPLIGAYGDSLATTPNLDRLADQGTLYENAFATTPVCAPSRFTLITGMFANAMGTENMRSNYPIPDFVQFFPKYLRDAGYYTTNNAKKDYNTIDQLNAWNESSRQASYKNRKPGQPFFHIKNITTTHESRLHNAIDTLIHDPDEIPIPPYHPQTPEIKRDWAHYYDQVTKMDSQVGEILDELKASGEADNTIVFYYSDHGGVLPRSKRFMFESGLHIPMIIYFPPKFKHLAPSEKRTDRLVSFVDFGATVLSLAGIDPPQAMHGKAFLGKYQDHPRNYLYPYRGRMDERFDLIRTVRDKDYLYVRNYMPHRIYGQHLNYLWNAPSMQSWYQEYLNENLTPVQRRFFETKPAEELYEISSDPHNVHNLADDPAYQDVLERMRTTNSTHLHQIKDLGFIPEEMIDSMRKDQSLYESVRRQSIPIDKIIETADLASTAKSADLNQLLSLLNHSNAAVRFWAATGFSVMEEKPAEIGIDLLKHANDPSPAVRIAIAEALYRYGNQADALQILEKSLNTPQPFARLRALNTLQALQIQHLPNSIIQKIRHLKDEDDNDYVRRASSELIK